MSVAACCMSCGQADGVVAKGSLVSDNPPYSPWLSKPKLTILQIFAEPTAPAEVFTLFDISARFITHIRFGLYYGNIQAEGACCDAKVITKGSLSYLSSPCFSKNVLQSGVGIVH